MSNQLEMDLGKISRRQEAEFIVRNSSYFYPNERKIYIRRIFFTKSGEELFSIKHREFQYDVEWSWIVDVDFDQAGYLLHKGLVCTWDETIIKRMKEWKL